MVVAAGADAVIGYLSLALLEPGDEIVCGWPSFPSYVIDARKLDAQTTMVPLAGSRYDLEALGDAISERTRIVFICNPNNPTGTMSTRAELATYFDRVPDHVLTVLDEAYWEYVESPGLSRWNRRVRAWRSKGSRLADVLEDLRPGRPSRRLRRRPRRRSGGDSQGSERVRRDAARARCGAGKPRRRRGARSATHRELGLPQPARRWARGSRALATRPRRRHFVYVDVGHDARLVFERLLHRGVIVRPDAAFGDDAAIRISAGTQPENVACLEALGATLDELRHESAGAD